MNIFIFQNCVKLSELGLTCTFRTSCYRTRLSWAHTQKPILILYSLKTYMSLLPRTPGIKTKCINFI